MPASSFSAVGNRVRAVRESGMIFRNHQNTRRAGGAGEPFAAFPVVGHIFTLVWVGRRDEISGDALAAHGLAEGLYFLVGGHCCDVIRKAGVKVGDYLVGQAGLVADNFHHDLLRVGSPESIQAHLFFIPPFRQRSLNIFTPPTPFPIFYARRKGGRKP